MASSAASTGKVSRPLTVTAAAATRVTEAVNFLSGRASSVTSAFCPFFTRATSIWFRSVLTSNTDMSASSSNGRPSIVAVIPGTTTSPGWTLRWMTVPSNGASISV